MSDLEKVRAIKGDVANLFQNLLNEEVAVGVSPLGKGEFALKVNLTTQPDESVQLPSEFEGVPIKVECVGKIQKQ